MGQDVFIFSVHVHPGSRRPGVGGAYGDHLVVRVRSRALHGRANEEVVTSLAHALGVARHDVALVRASRSRDKVIAVTDSPDVRRRLHTLRSSTDGDAAAP